MPTWNGDKGWGVEGTLIVSQRWSFGTIHVNVADARTRIGNGEAFSSLIIEGPYRWTVRPVVEGYYDRNLGAARTWSALCGAIWRVGDNVSFDAASRWARVDATSAFEIRAGFTWALHVWGKP